MSRLFNAALISSALITSLMVMPGVSLAQDQKAEQDRDHAAAAVKYHDKAHNDDHEWNNHEDQAYRTWAKEKHKKDVEFSKMNARDQQAYWNWRHDHSDADLKIDIH